MSLQVRTGIGERGARFVQFPITGREEAGEGLFLLGRTAVNLALLQAYEVIFQVEAQVSASGIGGVVELYDVTDGDVLVHSFVVNDTSPQQLSSVVTVSRSSTRLFEVRGGLDTGSPFGVLDKVQVWGSALGIRSQV